MPKAVATELSSPALSTDSSLSSAPESDDLALEDITTSVSVEQTGVVALVEESAVEILQSKKRRRTTETIEASAQVKRAKRDTGTRVSYKEAEEGEDSEEEKETPINIPEPSSQKCRQRGEAPTARIDSTTIKTETDEDIEVSSKGAVKRVQKKTKVEVEAVTEEIIGSNTPKRSRKRAKVSIEAEAEEQASSPTTLEKSKKKRKKAGTEEHGGEEEEVVDDAPKKPKRKRKTKEEKEAEAMPLAVRTTGLKMYLGAHVSSAKGPFPFQLSTFTACTYGGTLILG